MQLLGWGCASWGSISQTRSSAQNETRIRYFTYHCLMQVLPGSCGSGVCGQVWGCAHGVITQLQRVSLCFLLFQELIGALVVTMLGTIPLVKSMQRTIKLLDPFCSPSRGPVQARLCLGVARSCLEPSANNNSWLLWRSQCHWCVYLPVLLRKSRIVNDI